MSRNPTLIAGVLLALIAGLGAYIAITSAGDTEPFLAVTRDLPRGHVLRAGDLTEVDAHLGGAQREQAWLPDDRGAVVGSRLAQPVVAGQLLQRGDITERLPLAPGEVAFTLGVNDTFVWRDLTVGDHVRVWLVYRVRNPVTNQDAIITEPYIIAARLLDTRYDGEERDNITLAIADDPLTLSRMSYGLLAGTHVVFVLPDDYDPAVFEALLEEFADVLFELGPGGQLGVSGPIVPPSQGQDGDSTEEPAP